MIRAMIENGSIKPLEPLPADWTDGTEVIVEIVPDSPRSEAEMTRWLDELEMKVGMLNPNDQARMKSMLVEANRRAIDRSRPV